VSAISTFLNKPEDEDDDAAAVPSAVVAAEAIGAESAA
jgi:hypothetical protein